MKRHHISLALSAVFLAMLAGCSSTTPGRAIEREAQSRTAAATTAAPEQSDFPALGDANWKQGAFPNIENLRKLAPAMGKDQIRELLGWPHFTEGLWGVREWNYIFHFRTAAGGSDYITCQYMVRFNESRLSTGGWWKPQTCASLLAVPAVAVVAAQPAAVPLPPQTRRLRLSADGLFRFDGGRPEDLLPEGRSKIERLAQEILGSGKAPDRVSVRGHTDRLGSDAYNDALSRQRAETVRALFVAQGLNAANVTAEGFGKRQPVTGDCRGTQASPALVQCLQPDRRVEVEVVGER